MTEKIKPLRWEDFGPEAIPQLEQHTAKAAHDVWWTWPEAIAWVGSEDYRNIATLRQWGNFLKLEAGHTLKGQEDIARSFCTSPQQAEASLMQAIETGAIQTSGRSKPNASPMRLEPETWRGGAITYSRETACLVSKLDTWSAPWAYDIAVHRADLVACSGDGKSILAIDIGRAPSVKTGHPPSEDRIRAKAIEMKARGMDGQTIARMMKHEAGFETAGTVVVRDAIKGLWPPGRPKKSP